MDPTDGPGDSARQNGSNDDAEIESDVLHLMAGLLATYSDAELAALRRHVAAIRPPGPKGDAVLDLIDGHISLRKIVSETS